MQKKGRQNFYKCKNLYRIHFSNVFFKNNYDLQSCQWLSSNAHCWLLAKQGLMTSKDDRRSLDVPQFFGSWVFSGDLCSFFPDVGRSVRVFQLVYIHVEGHGVRWWEVFAEAGGGGATLRNDFRLCLLKPLFRRSAEREPSTGPKTILIVPPGTGQKDTIWLYPCPPVNTQRWVVPACGCL